MGCMFLGFLERRVHYITPEIAHHIISENGSYRITGSNPRFVLHSSRSKLPRRWVIISYLIESQGAVLEPILYIDSGNGYSEQHTIFLPQSNGRIEAIIRLPDQVQAIKLDPSSRADIFCLREIKISQINKFNALWKLINKKLIHDLVTPERFRNLRNELLIAWKKRGWTGVKLYLATLMMTRQKISPTSYEYWINVYDTITSFDRKKILERIEILKYKPLLSIIMPVHNINEKWLSLSINSILSQLYPEWELYIVCNSATVPPRILHILKKYQSNDQKIKVICQEINAHALVSNNALEFVMGEWIVLLDQVGELAEHALYMVTEEINAYPDANIIYSDEDKIDADGQRYEPWFKPDWNPDLMLSNNQIAHFGFYRTALVKAIGGFRSDYEKSQNYDLTLRAIEKTSADKIRHIPYILYHLHPVNELAADREIHKYQYQAARKALQDYLDRNHVDAHAAVGYDGFSHRVIYNLPEQLPKVSIIIPTKDMLDLLQVAVESILDRTDYPDMEIIIVDNQSKLLKTLAYLNELQNLPCIRLLRYDAPYNYSAINNWAVQKATGDLIALLNNDIEVITPSWLKEMVSHALRTEIGAVGAMLYYPKDTIQHAGIVLGLDGPAGHAHRDFPRGSSGYFGRACLIQNFSAVTAACIVMRRAVFEEVGGFDEENLAIAYNDVDLCLRIQEKRYRILWTPYAELYHHESASLGPPEAPERRKQFLKEMTYIKTRWKDIVEQDPFYNPNLTLACSNFSLAFPPRLRKPWQVGK
jgi:O-antigen biosynthesis protein